MIQDIKRGTFSKYHDFIMKNPLRHLEKELDPRAIKSVGDTHLHLTFDMCPSHDLDLEIINWLIENRIPATFMLNVEWCKENKDKDLTVFKNPLFSIQAHGNHHVNILNLSEEDQRKEIDDTITYLESTFDIKVEYYRFPHGAFTDYSIKYLNSKGIEFLAWTGKVLDRFKGKLGPKEESRDRAVANILKFMKGGDVYLLHTNGLGFETLDAIKQIINRAKKLKLNFTRL